MLADGMHLYLSLIPINCLMFPKSEMANLSAKDCMRNILRQQATGGSSLEFTAIGLIELALFMDAAHAVCLTSIYSEMCLE